MRTLFLVGAAVLASTTLTMAAAPTAKMVKVWPQPQRIPMSAALVMERSRLTIVDTAIT